jgi:hypothetical protein
MSPAYRWTYLQTIVQESEGLVPVAYSLEIRCRCEYLHSDAPARPCIRSEPAREKTQYCRVQFQSALCEASLKMQWLSTGKIAVGVTRERCWKYLSHPFYRVMRCPFGTASKGSRLEVRLEDRSNTSLKGEGGTNSRRLTDAAVSPWRGGSDSIDPEREQPGAAPSEGADLV